MMGVVACPCPCGHTFIAEMHPWENGSKAALLWTKVPNERKQLLDRWLGSEYTCADVPDSVLHKRLMPATPPKVFAAMISELKALDVAVATEIGKVPTYQQYVDGDTGKPPNVLYGINYEQAEYLMSIAGGHDAECQSCKQFKSITLSSMLVGKKICKACREIELIMETPVDAHEIGRVCATGVQAT